MVARCGYMWSVLSESFGETRVEETMQARKSEEQVFRVAKRVVVTTDRMRNYAIKQYGLPESKVKVIPNYVLTDLFIPSIVSPVPGRMCFVGRFSEEKNPLHLVHACVGMDVELIMIGDGPLKKSLEKKAKELGVCLKLIPNMPHNELPNTLGSCQLFLMASPNEGHPKALLEAMSCGLTVVAVDAPGVSDMIDHGRTGWLCGPDVQSMRESIMYLLAREDLRNKIGSEARRFVCDNFSLDRIVPLELDLIREVLNIPSIGR